MKPSLHSRVCLHGVAFTLTLQCNVKPIVSKEDLRTLSKLSRLASDPWQHIVRLHESHGLQAVE